MHTHFRAFFKKFFEKIYPFTCSHWEVPNYRVFLKNFLSGKKPSHLFGIAKPNDTLFHRKNEKIFLLGWGWLYFLAEKAPSLIPTERGQMHTLNRKKFLPLHLFGIERPKRTLFFKKKSEKSFSMKKYLSFVPTGGGLLGTVFLKKSKKIARQLWQTHFRYPKYN